MQENNTGTSSKPYIPTDESKPAIKSKAIWINILSGVIAPNLIIILKSFGIDVSSEVVAAAISILGGVNVLIRLVTSKKLSS